MSTSADTTTPQGLRERLFHAGYIADEELASLVWMGLSLERPLLLEGDAGVGKTAIASASAKARRHRARWPRAASASQRAMAAAAPGWDGGSMFCNTLEAARCSSGVSASGCSAAAVRRSEGSDMPGL